VPTLLDPLHTNRQSSCAVVGFGTVEGWWNATEEWRQFGPLATEQQWDELLRQTGYTGVDLEIRDYPDTDQGRECHLASIMVATPLENSLSELNGVHHLGSLTNGHGAHPPYEKDVVFLINEGSGVQQDLALAVSNQLKRNHFLLKTHITHLDRLPQYNAATSIVISLLEVNTPLLSQLGKADFEHLQRHMLAAHQIMWVTCPSSAESSPDFAPATGVFRSLRSEYGESKHIVTISLEPGTRSKEAFVYHVLQSCFLAQAPSVELEFSVRSGHLQIPRLVEEPLLDVERISRAFGQQKLPQLVTEPWMPERAAMEKTDDGARSKEERATPVMLEVATPGALDTLRFVEDPTYRKDLGPDEVEIQTAVVPVSFRDVFIALGRLGPDEEMGYECAGTVTRSNAAGFAPGDRVVMVAPGIRSYARAHADRCFKLPSGLLSFEEAVSGMNPGMTAWYALSEVARLKKGDSVLIHSAAGATGQMAVRFARYLGAGEIYVSVGSEEKRDLVVKPEAEGGLGVPAANIFYSRTADFVNGVKRATGGRGVDVVFNSLSGSLLKASWECVAPYGRFVDVGKADIMADTKLPMSGFAKNVSFSSVDLLHIAMSDSVLTRSLVDKVLQLAVSKKVRGPGPLHLFPVGETERAFRYMQGGKNTGRILITMGGQDVVQVSRNSPTGKNVEDERDGDADLGDRSLSSANLHGTSGPMLLML